jgi:Fic family protein
MNTKKREYTERVNLRVTKTEKEKLLQLAQAHSLKLSEYLRQAGLAQELKGRTEIEAIITLAKINADQARLGNLFKLALDGGSGDANDLETIIREIKKTQRLLNETVDRI